MKLGEIINRLKQIYTEHIGVEYMHIWDHEQVNWISAHPLTTLHSPPTTLHPPLTTHHSHPPLPRR